MFATEFVIGIYMVTTSLLVATPQLWPWRQELSYAFDDNFISRSANKNTSFMPNLVAHSATVSPGFIMMANKVPPVFISVLTMTIARFDLQIAAKL